MYRSAWRRRDQRKRRPGMLSSAAALAPPVNSVAPVASGSLTVGSVLSVTTGTWTNSPTSYAYQWKRDAVDIPSAITNIHTLVVADLGAMMSCRVTATNADGSASADSNSLGPVTTAAPILSAASAVDFSDIFVWGRATTNTASGTLYAVVVPSADATPTAVQISESKNAAGTVITQSGNQAVTSTGAKTLLIRNLTAATSYKVCLTHQAGSEYSNVVTASFTTDTLIISFATAGAATNMTASTGSAAFGTNQADPIGGTGAIRWTDSNDAGSGQVLATCAVAAFFNGVNKVHLSVKTQGGAAWIRNSTAAITVLGITTHWNTSTGAIGTNNATWTPTPVTFDLGGGWMMWSGQANLAGADLAGQFTLNKCAIDNNTTITRNGTNIQDLYNIRITRV